MFNSKVPTYYLPLALGAGLLIAILGSGFIGRGEANQPVKLVNNAAERVCETKITQIDGYRNIRPLLSSEPLCESPRYSAMKDGLQGLIQSMKNDGVLTEASVYVRDFRKGEWTAVNGNVMYEPGSLMKVPLLMTYLRMAEKDPAVMSKKFSVRAGTQSPKFNFFPPSASIEPGKSYEVNELLDYAIRKSDNMAVVALLQHVDIAQFHRTYTDLGLRDFKDSDPSYPSSVNECSTFFKALYNSTYLSIDDSELAISFLMGSEFDQGIKAGLPAGTPVANKFGEAGDGTGLQLHETALVYAGQDPYLITVMTKGPIMEALPGTIAAISRLVYAEMMRMRGAS